MISYLVHTPKELLHDRIVSFLGVGDVVRFDSALLNHVLRRHVHQQLNGALLFSQSMIIDIQSKKWLLKRNMGVSTLNLKETATDLSLLKQLTGRAECISFEYCDSITTEDLVDVLPSCLKLKSLILNRSLNSFVWGSIAANCRELESISVPGTKGLCAAHFAMLTVSCKRLTNINLDRCYEWINDICFETIAVNCPQLRSVQADNCFQCGDSAIQALAQHCHDLHHLSICGWHKLTDEGLNALEACTELSALKMAATSVSSSCVIALTQSCTKLEDISLPSWADSMDLAVAALVRHCPLLASLRCSSPSFTDASLQYLRSCLQLTSLILHNASISITALLQSHHHCAKLQRLELNQCTLNCAIAAEKLSMVPAFSSVRNIDIRSAKYLDDIAFVALITQCPNVTELDLHMCTELTDLSILAMALHCTKLQSLDLSYVAVSDAAVCALAKSCPNMRQLHLSSNSVITDASVVEVLQKCHHLRELSLRSCVNISSRILDALVQHGACIRVIDLGRCSIDISAMERFERAKPNCRCLFTRHCLSSFR